MPPPFRPANDAEMSPRPEQHIVTYKCEGCGRRAPAPAPYGGFKHTACSTACYTRAIHRHAQQQSAQERAACLARQEEAPDDSAP